MIRKYVGVKVALLFLAGFALAAEDKKEDKKKPKFDTVVGTFESYKDGTLTLKIEDKKKEYKVSGDADVAYTAGKDKTKIQKAKDGLKDVKKGSFVAVTLDGKKILGIGVVVGTLPKDKPKEKAKDK